MKRIDAIIRSQCLNNVKDRLTEIGVEGLTVAEVKGFGRQKGREVYRGVEYTVEFLPKNLVMIIADDEHVPEIIEAIIAGARTGKIGDGKIFVTAIEEVVRIRSGEWNHAAV
jgi:nitrogen regulatory protein P-II 1